MTMIPTELQGKVTCDVEMAGRLLGISRNSAYVAAKAGTIPALRIGGRIVVPVVPLLKMLGIEADTDPEPTPVMQEAA